MASSPVAAVGSSIAQWSRRTRPGSRGHRSSALPQSVITRSDPAASATWNPLEVCIVRSIPFSAITFGVSGWIPFGSSPALRASIASAPSARAKASAIWLRAEFPVHRNRIRFLRIVSPLRASLALAIGRSPDRGLGDSVALDVQRRV